MDRSPTEDEVVRAERVAAAAERVAAAMASIRMSGGSVGFDVAELERLALGSADARASEAPRPTERS